MVEGAGSTVADFTVAGSTVVDFTAAGATAAGSTAADFTVAAFTAIDLAAFAVASARWDGPISRTHTNGAIIRATGTTGASTATRRPGITAPIPPAITRI